MIGAGSDLEKGTRAEESGAASAAGAAHRRVFLRSAAIVATSVLLSRVLGFFREWTLAHEVGSNALTDAYYAAFTVPDILNYLLAGGALSITFLPIFSEYYSNRGKEEAWHVFSIVLSFTCVSLAILLIVAEIFAPLLTRWLAPGFDAEQQRLVTRLTRIMLPAQACFLIGGVLTAVQYARGHFLIPSLAPLIYNGMIMACGVLLADRIGVEGFSWGVLAGALVGNCGLQIYGVRRFSAQFRFSLALGHPGFRRFLRLTIPVMAGFSVLLVDDWAIRWFGSFLKDASITWLSYAKTLMRVVVALFGQAAGVAAFPILARLAAEKKWAEMREGLEDSLRHVIVAIVPVSALMALLSRPVVYILFSRTRLGPVDMEQSALALEIFLIGAIAWGTQTILGRGFYALGDTLTPTLVGSGLTLASLPLYGLFSDYFAHLGLAAASSLAVLIYTAVLWWVLFRRLEMPLGTVGKYLLQTAGCAAAASGAALLARHALASYLAWQSLSGSMVYIVTLSLVFGLVFLPLASRVGIISLQDLRSAFATKVAHS
jgi:putative peptidoglycan lipid II flippase